MSNAKTQISNPYSSGGGGVNFETRVQTSFVVLMAADGHVPCFPDSSISEIMLQGKHAGYETDDLIVFTKATGDRPAKKLLAQIKHSIQITESSNLFGEVIQAGWKDFSNTKLFARERDAIALITGPLSITDTQDVRFILEWARSSKTAKDFFDKVELMNFSSDKKRKKLQAFRHHLKNANGGKDVSDDDIFQFLRHFHLLGYDLDVRAGVMLSLLHTVIGQHSQDATEIWLRMLDEVQSMNQNAGTITKESLSEDIQNAFRRAGDRTIPAEISRTLVPPTKPDWIQYKHAAELMIAGLVGSWDERFEADMIIVGQLLGEDYKGWILKIREALQEPDTPIAQRNGVWAVSDRMGLWQELGPRVFDDHLDRFRQIVVGALAERDPRFELAPEERYAASVQGRVLIHSHELRQGLASSLALLGNYPEALTNCSAGKAEAVATLAIRDIFDGSDWQLWASLGDLLSLLAEAVPSEFLDAVETALQQTPCPFDELFSQEGRGIMGGNYMVGLLWALETLAWEEGQLVRVSVILGELADRDPGGNWSNRPSGSLVTIFLPWFPQTIAPIEKRKAALTTLQKQVPKAAWQLLLNLLPNSHQMSSGSVKPAWRKTIPSDWAEKVTMDDYRAQVMSYAEMAVEMARHDMDKLSELVSRLDDLPPPALEKVLEQLSSDEVTNKLEDERLGLWDSLIELSTKHKKYSDAKWAMDAETVTRIDATAIALAPKRKQNIYRRLFGERDMDLYEEKGTWQEQREKLDKRRRFALKDILDTDGREAIAHFADTVESPWTLGLTLGSMDDNEMDPVVLPDFLESENRNLRQLANGFIRTRYYSQGCEWIDSFDMTGWSLSQMGQFLAYLPFTSETWEKVEKLLGEREEEYWTKAEVNPFQVEGKMNVAVDKLIEHGRPFRAIDCLNVAVYKKQPLDKERSVKALLSAVSTKEPAAAMDAHHTKELIKHLQDDADANPEDIYAIEWAYLPLLDGYHGDSPRLLGQRLATDPDFFCEAIRTLFRSKKESATKRNLTEREKEFAGTVYRLFREWRTPPGSQADGSFSGESFRQWLESVKFSCEKSGHTEVALLQVGNVLIHCPADPDGLWMHRTAAEELNALDAEKMRSGFGTALFNARGIHTVDPSGASEIALEKKYRQQADEVEDAGYQRIAVTLRQLADSYAREAKRVQEEHQQDEDEA